jgi:ADP-heptose:LPS heptosyltransferase
MDWGPDITDFGTAAAMLSALDLLVTVDTATAHLAGALGLPALVLLPHVPDWRWGLSGEASDWYGSLRLLRQQRQGDWSAPIAAVTAALAT